MGRGLPRSRKGSTSTVTASLTSTPSQPPRKGLLNTTLIIASAAINLAFIEVQFNRGDTLISTGHSAGYHHHQLHHPVLEIHGCQLSRLRASNAPDAR
nr:hypothetical protein CFP56_77406 [Quercus suber]